MVKRLVLLVLAGVGLQASAADPPARRDLVKAIRVKLALDAEADASRCNELQDVVDAAKVGRINPYADKSVNCSRGVYVFRSLRDRAAFVRDSEAAVAARETIHADAAKDLGKVVGPMGLPVMDAVGTLKPGKGVEIVVLDVVTGEMAKCSYSFVEKGQRQERLFVLAADTSRMLRGKLEVPGVYWMGGVTVLEKGGRVPLASVVVLTDGERILVGERGAK